jgi:hypothetical protein
MLRRVALVRTEVPEGLIIYILSVTRIDELATMLRAQEFLRNVPLLLVIANVVSSSPILVNLRMGAIPSSETLVLTRAKRRNIPEDVKTSYLTVALIFTITN